MDYKTLIILLALLFLIILTYREVSSLKEQLSTNMNIMAIDMKQNNDNIIARVNNNMLKCVSQIKDISGDNLQQLRKITTLNQQSITKKIANHFTEETDDSEMKPDLNYFSDTKQQPQPLQQTSGNKSYGSDNRKIFEKVEKHSNYYMSEPTNKSNKSKTSDMKIP